MRNRIIYFLAIALISLSIKAQNKIADTLKRELIVVNAESLSLEKSTALDYRLSTSKPKINKSNFEFDKAKNFYTGYNIAEFNSLPNVQIKHPMLSKQKGYIDLSLGLMYDARLNFAYNILNTQKDLLSVSLSALHSNHNYSQDLIKNKMLYTGYKAGLDYQKNIKNNHLLYLSAYVDGSRNNLHGRYNPYNYPKELDFRNSNPIRNIYSIDLNAGIVDINKDDSRFSYILDFDFSLFNLSYTALQAREKLLENYLDRATGFDFRLKPNLSYDINGDHSLHLDNDIYLSKTSDDATGKLGLFSNIKPYYHYDSSSIDFRWYIKVGAMLGLDRTSKKTDFLISPYVDLSMKWALDNSDFFSRALDINFLIDGGNEFITHRDYFKESPYSYYLGILNPDRKNIGAKTTISYNFNKNTRLAIALSYDNFERVMENYFRVFRGVYKDYPYATYFRPSYNKYSRTSIIGNYNQNIPNYNINLDLFFMYNFYSSVQKRGVSKPKTETKLSISYKLASWLFSANYKLYTGLAYNGDYFGDTDYKKLDPYSRLGLRVAYNLNNKISFYADGSMAPTNSKNEYFIYYPEPSANLLIGFDYKF